MHVQSAGDLLKFPGEANYGSLYDVGIQETEDQLISHTSNRPHARFKPMI